MTITVRSSRTSLWHPVSSFAAASNTYPSRHSNFSSNKLVAGDPATSILLLTPLSNKRLTYVFSSNNLMSSPELSPSTSSSPSPYSGWVLLVLFIDLIDISPKGLIYLSKSTVNLKYLTLYKSNRFVSDVLEESFDNWENVKGICFCMYWIT